MTSLLRKMSNNNKVILLTQEIPVTTGKNNNKLLKYIKIKQLINEQEEEKCTSMKFLFVQYIIFH